VKSVWKCCTCNICLDDEDLVYDSHVSGDCETCCPHCGTWLDDDDVVLVRAEA
jgi:hypothetical protein